MSKIVPVAFRPETAGEDLKWGAKPRTATNNKENLPLLGENTKIENIQDSVQAIKASNYAKQRQEMKDRIVQEVLEAVLPDVCYY